MKRLSREEMKNLAGGTKDSIDPADGNNECISECVYIQALCGANNFACSTGPGAYSWKCCFR